MAIDTLIERHGERVMGLLCRILVNEEDAKDTYQDAWFALWRALPRLRTAEDPWPFIRKTALRKAIDRVRARRRGVCWESALDRDLAAPVLPEAPHLDLGGLNWEERACLVLFFWEACSVREIADELRVPPGTVKTWMFRARGKLRRALVTENEASMKECAE